MTTYPTSVVPKAKAAIVAALTAATAPPVLVSYGDLGTNIPQDVIVVGACKSRKVAPFTMVGTMGAGSLYETFTIEVQVFTDRHDAQLAYERAYELTALVETAIRTDPTLGGLVIRAYPTGGHDDPENTKAGHAVAVILDIDCEAVL